MTRRSIVLSLAALAATAAVALPITASSADHRHGAVHRRGPAGPPERTITVTNGKGKMVFADVAPLGMKHGKLSLGDRIVQTQQVLIHGKLAGWVNIEGTIVSPKPTTFAHFKATERLVGHLSGGEIFAIGYVDSAADIDRATIIGGTGDYLNARGTIAGTDNGAVITLE
jgi:hypothetical protein